MASFALSPSQTQESLREALNNLDQYSLISEPAIDDESPRRFTKLLEVSVNPKFAFKPIVEVRKFLAGEFLSSMKKEQEKK